MKVFVTGGSGFIGQRIVDQLVKRGDEVVCLQHKKGIDRPGITTVQGDLLRKETLASMRGCDAVIANAAIYEFGPSRSVRKTMRDINVTGTKNTLDAALELGIPKIVYTSTVAVLGDTTPYGVATEENIAGYAYPCLALYNITKREAHLYAQQLVDQKQAPIVLAMPSVVFGEGDHSAVGDFFQDLAAGTALGLPKLNIKYNFNYVGDVAAGILLCLDKGKPGPYFIAGPEANNLNPTDFYVRAAELGSLPVPKRRVSLGLLRVAEILYRLKGALTNKHQKVNAETLDGFKLNWQVTNAKAVRELGYTTRPLDEGIRLTIEWYKQKYGKKV